MRDKLSSPATALSPCPFCGGEASHATCTITRDRDIEGNKGTFTGHFINCIVCGADNQGIAEGYRTPEQAAERWNRRTIASADTEYTGYAVVMDDPNSAPEGFWWVGAWHHKEIADDIAKKHGPAAHVIPISSGIASSKR